MYSSSTIALCQGAGASHPLDKTIYAPLLARLFRQEGFKVSVPKSFVELYSLLADGFLA